MASTAESASLQETMNEKKSTQPSRTWLIVHHSDSPAWYVDTFLKSKGRSITNVYLTTQQLPAVDDTFEGIVVLGGAQGAYEEDQHPWLKTEKQWLREHVARGTPILGICLGCQLLADALGGRAYESPNHPEIGIVTLQLTNDGESHPIFGNFGHDAVDQPKFICHHGDIFEVPPKGKLLAVTSLNNNAEPSAQRVYPQAFQYGSAIGVQFHPEANTAQFACWIKKNLASPPNKYQRYFGKDGLQQIEALVESVTESTQATTQRFFAKWWSVTGFDDQLQSNTTAVSKCTKIETGGITSPSEMVSPTTSLDSAPCADILSPSQPDPEGGVGLEVTAE